LRDAGCDELQGFFISRAQPIEKLAHLVDILPESELPVAASSNPHRLKLVTSGDGIDANIERKAASEK